eukprot:Rmarinus@m.20045
MSSKIAPIEKEFDRLSKRQRLSYSTKCVDKLLKELEKTRTSLSDESKTVEESILRLKKSVKDEKVLDNQSADQKELHVAINKLGKAIDKNMVQDLSGSGDRVVLDSDLLHDIVADDLFRNGCFNVGMQFLKDAQLSRPPESYEHFVAIYQVLDAVKRRDLQPALKWAAEQSERLRDMGSGLEFKLHRLQFVQFLSEKRTLEALAYARKHFAPFSATHMDDIQRLMGCFLYSAKLNESRYADLLSDRHWTEVEHQLTRDCCALQGLSYESPLRIGVTAGTAALPSLLKLATVQGKSLTEWQHQATLPVEIPFGVEYRFHSVFTCPVSRENATKENPPMLLPCGHVLCKMSLQKLARGSSGRFKCPYCPAEQSSANALKMDI